MNLCANRFVKMQSCFVDDNDAPIVLKAGTFRFFDIDHDNRRGPEVLQFMCSGGTFSLYGYEQEDVDNNEQQNSEFLVHMSTNAKVLEREYTGETSLNGLPVHVYDCPDAEWVTLWSSRFGIGKDNPTSGDIPLGGYGKEQVRHEC